VHFAHSEKSQAAGHEFLKPFGGAKHGGDEATLTIEHDDRLKAVFVVMRIEQTQLLAAMTASTVSSMSSVIRLGTW
jgi:hypothetical protein